MAPKEDRRVTRTKRLLKKALFELISEKRYDTITVQDILDRADIGRSTFYAHFNSKDDLLIGDAPNLYLSFDDIQEEEGEIDIIPSFLHLFQHIEEQYPLIRSLIGGEGVNIAQQMMQRHLHKTLEAHFNQLAQNSGQPLPVPAQIWAHYLTGGLMALIAWWLREEMPYPPEEMNQMFRQMARGTAVVSPLNPGISHPDPNLH